MNILRAMADQMTTSDKFIIGSGMALMALGMMLRVVG